MKTNKKIGAFVLIWAICLALFNVIVFVSPNEAAGMNKFGGAFWAGYIFISVAFIGQLICSIFALRNENKKLFYRLPLITISYTGLIVMLVFGTLCMAIPDLPNWVGIIVCAIVLTFEIIAVLKATAAVDFVEKVEAKVQVETAFIKEKTNQSNALFLSAASDEIKTECKKVYEAFRYSDPRSNGATQTTETTINLQMVALTDAVRENDTESVTVISKELLSLINQRNIECKSSK